MIIADDNDLKYRAPKMIKNIYGPVKGNVGVSKSSSSFAQCESNITYLRTALRIYAYNIIRFSLDIICMQDIYNSKNNNSNIIACKYDKSVQR